MKPSNENSLEVHLFVRGQVQGVCFRMETQQKAFQLGLSGWVRNLPNGDVEILAQGTKEKVDELIEWCHQGPPLAKVNEVQVNKAPINKNLKTFEIC